MVGRGEVGITVINQTLMLGRPAWYNKLKQQTFENNSNMLRTNLDPFKAFFGFPVETIMKADCFNVLSSF